MSLVDNSPGIVDLQNELIEGIRQLPSIENTFSVLNIDDMLDVIDQHTPPFVGVGYDGASLAIRAGNTVEAGISGGRNSVNVLIFQFSCILAVQYRVLQQPDTKLTVMTLLDEMRQQFIGRPSAVNRPWVFIAERPEPEVSKNGIAFYSQIWHITKPVLGLHYL